MGVLEAVDRLVLVADDRMSATLSQQVDQLLLGLVQVLVLISEDVVVSSQEG
jgi:hypothetical protein